MKHGEETVPSKIHYIHTIDCTRKGETRLYQFSGKNRRRLAAAKYANLLKSNTWDEINWYLARYTDGIWGADHVKQKHFESEV
jgi:hypothetical protein